MSFRLYVPSIWLKKGIDATEKQNKPKRPFYTKLAVVVVVIAVACGGLFSGNSPIPASHMPDKRCTYIHGVNIPEKTLFPILKK